MSLSFRAHQMLGLLRLLGEPGALRAMRTWRPFSVTAFRMTRALHRQGFRFEGIVDGGANIGQFARAAAETWPTARILSVEPLPDIADRLRDNLASEAPRVRVTAAALGPATGTLDFYRTDYSLASSALVPSDRAATRIAVPVVRLDDVLSEHPLPRPLLVKLDLQGFELEALRGATATLARADAVLLETAFQASYADEPLFRDVLSFMEDAGFRFARPVDTLEENGRITQMDALFVRDERATTSGGVTPPAA